MGFHSTQMTKHAIAALDLSKALREVAQYHLELQKEETGSTLGRLFSLLRRSLLGAHVCVGMAQAPTTQYSTDLSKRNRRRRGDGRVNRSEPAQRRQDGACHYNGKILACSIIVAAMMLALSPEIGLACGGIASIVIPDQGVGTTGQIASGRILGNAVPGCGDSGVPICNFVNAVTLSGTPATFDGVVTQQLSTQSDIQVETIAISSPRQYIKKVPRQLETLRGLTPQTSGSSLPRNTRGGAAGADGYGFIGPFGFSISGGGSFGDKDSENGETGFSINTADVVAIMDYPFSQRVIGGLSAGYVHAAREFVLSSGNLDTDTFRVAPFVHFIPIENTYVHALIGYSHLSFDSIRRFTPFFNSNPDKNDFVTKEDATADFSGDQFFASLGGGYTHNLGAWSLRGYIQGDYINLHVGSYTESGGEAFVNNTIQAGMLNLHVNSQNIHSLTSTLGVEVSYTLSTRTYAGVIIPRVWGKWVHEFSDNPRTINSQFQDQGLVDIVQDTNMALRTAGPRRDWGNVGTGIQLLFPYAIVGFIDYEALLMKRASNHTVTGGLRVNF